MRIGEISAQTGLSIETIRFYEKSGLINPSKRSDNGYRIFEAEAIATLNFIARCRSLDIPLPSIKKLIRVRNGSVSSCCDANNVISEQLTKLRLQIQQLKILEQSFTQLQAICDRELAPQDCLIIRNLQGD